MRERPAVVRRVLSGWGGPPRGRGQAPRFLGPSRETCVNREEESPESWVPPCSPSLIRVKKIH